MPLGLNTVLHLAIEVGRRILENGGETYRVEEAITIVCRSYGMTEAESYVTPTGIMISVTDPEGRTQSLVRRIRKRTVNLERMAMASALSRKIKETQPSPEEVMREIERIDTLHLHPAWRSVLAAGVVTGFFTLFFGGGSWDFLLSFAIGMSMKAALESLSEAGLSDFFSNAMGGAWATLVGHGVALFVPNLHSDKIVIGSVMLLVPGLAITNAVRDTLAGDLVAGLARASEACLTAIAIAFGTGVALQAVQALQRWGGL